MNYKFIAYAIDFSSFLIEKLGVNSSKINQIILFGSISRGTESSKSDIDLFIDIKDKDRNFEETINSLRDKFYESMKFKKYWNLLNVKNEINLTIGKMEEWGELQRSMLSSGIVLFGKFAGKSSSINYMMFIINSGKDRNKNISLWRGLYGYSQKIKNKIYSQEGLIKNYKGKKLSNGVFIIPAEYSIELVSFLKQNKISYQMIPFWSEIL